MKENGLATQGTLPRAAIYARISKDADGDELGVKRQAKLCREAAAEKGWDVVGTYVDNDRSAMSRTKKRPEWERLLGDIEEGRIDAVVAYSSSRMYRRPADLQRLINLAEKGRVEIATVASGRIDLDTADGRMLAGILANIDQGEAERTAERIRAQRAQQAATGDPPRTGRPGFGYRRVEGRFEIVPEQAAVIREIVQRLIDGQSMHSVVAYLNREGVQTYTGTSWSRTTVDNIIRSPRIAGRRVHRGEDIGPGNWEPIVTLTAWRAVNAVLDARAAEWSWTPPRAGGYLLSGLLVCGSCERDMTHKADAGIYLCPRWSIPHPDGHPSIQAKDVEEYVLREASVRVKPPSFVVVNPGRAAASLIHEQEELEARLEQLALDRYMSNSITEAEFFAARKALLRRLEEIRAKIDASTPAARSRHSMTPVTEREELEILVRQAVVQPVGRGSRAPIEERVSIEWHEGVVQTGPVPEAPRLASRPKPVCSEPNCDRPASALARCSMHYQRLKRSDPKWAARQRRLRRERMREPERRERYNAWMREYRRGRPRRPLSREERERYNSSRREKYAADAAERDRILARNREWRRQKAARDPEWKAQRNTDNAERRREERRPSVLGRKRGRKPEPER